MRSERIPAIGVARNAGKKAAKATAPTQALESVSSLTRKGVARLVRNCPTLAIVAPVMKRVKSR
jgi:hypothetical protein